MSYPKVVESTTLINNTTRNNAEYVVSVVEVAQGQYQAKYEWGTSGQRLQVKLDPKKPVTLAAARSLAVAKVSEKTRGDYVEVRKPGGGRTQAQAATQAPQPLAAPAAPAATANAAKAKAKRKGPDLGKLLGVSVAVGAGPVEKLAKADAPQVDGVSQDQEVVYDDV